MVIVSSVVLKNNEFGKKKYTHITNQNYLNIWSLNERKIKRLCPTILGWGCQPPSIHRRYPLLHAAELLSAPFFRPGARLNTSLDDLVFPASSLKRTISTPCLAWTPDRHRAAEGQNSTSRQIQLSLDLKNAGLRDHPPHGPGRER
ncbi:hypothetical protein TNIN_225031 [Trichonephila inaurata madagascariensis]|uniref:Uncharacterized protein n=1 Tax=Trichonephila inaurata madagascariensis TaxID=2747483 RepID=A0A8X6WPH7_9ARAC|nr:hypothetical protein TNIN_225031 [Trichonephila inaurata madagascariensis]